MYRALSHCCGSFTYYLMDYIVVAVGTIWTGKLSKVDLFSPPETKVSRSYMNGNFFTDKRSGWSWWSKDHDGHHHDHQGRPTDFLANNWLTVFVSFNSEALVISLWRDTIFCRWLLICSWAENIKINKYNHPRVYYRKHNIDRTCYPIG